MATRIWCFNDAHNWGGMLASKAKLRGYDARVFDEPSEPTDGYVFMHMHHHPNVRAEHKRMMAKMAMNPELILIPNYISSVLYDDKLEQSRHFAKWMPLTRQFTTPGSAKKFLNAGPKMPFISKTSEGAGSHNVRLIQTSADALTEIRHAFSDLGIRIKYGLEQRGYLLWQEFVPGNPGDIRVLAIGTQRLVMRRTNRPDRPFASGSGNVQPVTKLDDELISALQFANAFFKEHKQTWCGIDLVYDHARKRWLLLETTVGWTLHAYYECAFFNDRLERTKRTGNDIWDVLLDEVEQGIFD